MYDNERSPCRPGLMLSTQCLGRFAVRLRHLAPVPRQMINHNDNFRDTRHDH